MILHSISFSVIDLSLDVIVDLAKHPNIIGIKESGGNVSNFCSVMSCPFALWDNTQVGGREYSSSVV